MTNFEKTKPVMKQAAISQKNLRKTKSVISLYYFIYQVEKNND
jgi:hypothetical protein